jgi:AraC-like DNA-binding protein
MIRGTKAMIAGCKDRIWRAGCGGCGRREVCSDMFPQLLGALLAQARPPATRPDASRAAAASPFLAFLGRVAKAVEARDDSPARLRTGSSGAGSAPAPLGPGPFRTRVERCLEPLLPSGEVGIERIARALGCSRQTLYRRLKAEGTTFEQVLDSLRRRLALRYIEGERTGVKQAAYRLGFSDPAAFSRAFKRWTGRSPGSAPS